MSAYFVRREIVTQIIILVSIKMKIALTRLRIKKKMGVIVCNKRANSKR